MMETISSFVIDLKNKNRFPFFFFTNQVTSHFPFSNIKFISYTFPFSIVSCEHFTPSSSTTDLEETHSYEMRACHLRGALPKLSMVIIFWISKFLVINFVNLSKFSANVHIFYNFHDLEFHKFCTSLILAYTSLEMN